MNASIAHNPVPTSSSSWLVLAMSSCALLLLLGWSAQNTSKLLKQSLFSFTAPVKTASPLNSATKETPAEIRSELGSKFDGKIVRKATAPTAEIAASNGVTETQQGANSLIGRNLTQDNPSVNHATVSESAAGVESRIAQKVESAFVKMRREELSTLNDFALNITFERASSTLQQEASTSLDKIFELLFLYAESTVVVSVASSELNSVVENEMLSVERTQAVVAYLVDRGIDIGRFSLQTRSGVELPSGTHQVYVSAEAVGE